ncbi:MAG TPA: hypothetical protein VJU80_00650, partial [Solirubrobacteraceae bacterium]|nr:hypothetical protein [Solirubrobacteraceae bacterium]
MISASPDSPEIEAVHFTLNLVDHELAAGRPIRPTLSGSPLDALVMRVMYAHGRLQTTLFPSPRPESTS